MFVSSGLTAWTQDCVYDEVNNRLLAIGYEANAPIQGISLEDSTITNFPTNYDYYDGITMDQFGNVYLASHGGPGRIIKYNAELTGEYEVISTGHDEPAGLHYNQQDNILAVPNFGGSTVDFIPIAITDIDPDQNFEFEVLSIYPNPFSEKINILISTQSEHEIGIAIYSIDGKIVWESEQENRDQKKRIFIWSGMDKLGKELPSGYYFVRISQENNNYFKKIIKY